jgi:hypothetical protein
MKPHQVFARLSPERAFALLAKVQEKLPGVYTQAVGAACVTLKTRPQFMMKQPPEKRAAFVRQALSRFAAAPIAEEVLAAYFLEVRRDLLTEWLDALGIEHENGVLKQDDPAEPAREKLVAAVAKFREGADPEDRQLLLEAFAAQSAVEWPALDAVLGVEASPS